MNQKRSKDVRILGISPSSRGMGFAVLEGPDTLIDWGVKTGNRNNEAHALAQVEALLEHYQPGWVVVRDCMAKNARCSKRIQTFINQISASCTRRNIPIKPFSRAQIKKAFSAAGEANKDDIARMIAEKFPNELGSRLPPKRRLWTSEDYRMGIFEAVSLALALFAKKA